MRSTESRLVFGALFLKQHDQSEGEKSPFFNNPLSFIIVFVFKTEVIMSLQLQKNLFEKSDDPLWMEFRTLEKSQDNLRKGIFQRYGALMKLVESLQSELVELRSQLKASSGSRTKNDQIDFLSQ